MRIPQFSKLILLLFFSFSFHCSFSQFNYGVRAGAQYTQGVFFNKGLCLPHGGIFLTYRLNRFFSFEGDLLYTEKVSLLDTEPDYFLKYTFRYVNAPILLNLKTSNRTSIFLGPELGFLLSAHYRNPNEYARIESKYLRWFNLGIGAGLIINSHHICK